MTRTIAVLAKAPVAGRVKTRLCPPCDPQQAADLAGAALADTLDAVLAVPGVRHVLVLDGEAGSWLPPGIDMLAQRGAGLDERLAYAYDDLGDAALLVGMDTPQLTPALLAGALGALDHSDAVLGPSLDGGWWGIGLHAPDRDVFLGVPMSSPRTHAAQLVRLEEQGLRVAPLPWLQDVDEVGDARAVAAVAPGTRFATTWRRIAASLDRARPLVGVAR